MLVSRVRARSFRSYERLDTELGEGLTVVHGPNGAGKTNLLEAVYFGLTGRSCRTSNERELVRFGDRVARVEVDLATPDGHHGLEVGFEPGEAKLLKVDGAAVERLEAGAIRPLVSVFLPDRLELVKGAPGVRRSHLDQFVVALWPGRGATRGSYTRALAQRNALVARIRSGAAGPAQLDAWDAELAARGAELMADRAAAAALLTAPFARLAAELGLPAPATLAYRPRSQATDSEGLRAELLERRAADIERGFTAHGPHRDELELAHDGRALRAYGSQGQQRLALLALLFAEREVLLSERGTAPLMLLDDVMSELDAARRERLVELVRAAGQAVVTATDAEHVPRADDACLLAVTPGSVTVGSGVAA